MSNKVSYSKWVTNKHSIKIMRACLTCKYGSNVRPLTICGCSKSEHCGEGIKSSCICDQWKLKPFYHDAGKGGGKVKKKRYLMDVINGDECIETIRQRYKAIGGIYEDF